MFVVTVVTTITSKIKEGGMTLMTFQDAVTSLSHSRHKKDKYYAGKDNGSLHIQCDEFETTPVANSVVAHVTAVTAKRYVKLAIRLGFANHDANHPTPQGPEDQAHVARHACPTIILRFYECATLNISS